ncbi:MAG: peptide chain release factor 1 [Candidatus Firestonebacteria bacterium]|nr:peptide chain release factor 1 [Candidatus Firestonebacteria bacterium]
MWDKLKLVEERFDSLEKELANPALVADQAKFRETVKGHAELSELVENIRKHRKLSAELSDAQALAEQDPDMAEMAQDEIVKLKQQLQLTEDELKRLLTPRDPHDGKNVFLEIRAGTGGDEAALFAADLFRMYSRFAEGQGWKVSVLDSNSTNLSGFKEIIFEIDGKDVYRTFKFEAGVHRVQRVPQTEASGRIHTSAVTVAVMPEVDEVEVNLNPNDLRIDIFCSSGAGGQSVNTTYSAIRITHLPTGISVQCQDERSQLKNKAKAMKVLQARLQQAKEEEQAQAQAADRKNQVGSGDRSEKIRTYNYPQNRVTDHRIGVSLYNLDVFMNGEIGELMQKLLEADQAEKLSQA